MLGKLLEIAVGDAEFAIPGDTDQNSGVRKRRPLKSEFAENAVNDRRFHRVPAMNATKG